MNIATFCMMGLLLIACLAIYYQSDAFNLKCIIATRDGKTYCVRERAKMEMAANKLAQVTEKMLKLKNYLTQNYENDDRVTRLNENFNANKIMETLPTSELEAYSENKGEKIAFCLDKHKNGSKLIDINTLTFVAFHEMSHIITEETGHPKIFWDNFKWILEKAKEANIYTPIDYKNNPTTYCGMKIDDNPYFDLV